MYVAILSNPLHICENLPPTLHGVISVYVLGGEPPQPSSCKQNMHTTWWVGPGGALVAGTCAPVQNLHPSRTCTRPGPAPVQDLHPSKTSSTCTRPAPAPVQHLHPSCTCTTRPPAPAPPVLQHLHHPSSSTCTTRPPAPAPPAQHLHHPPRTCTTRPGPAPPAQDLHHPPRTCTTRPGPAPPAQDLHHPPRTRTTRPGPAPPVQDPHHPSRTRTTRPHHPSSTRTTRPAPAPPVQHPHHPSSICTTRPASAPPVQHLTCTTRPAPAPPVQHLHHPSSTCTTRPAPAPPVQHLHHPSSTCTTRPAPAPPVQHLHQHLHHPSSTSTTRPDLHPPRTCTHPGPAPAQDLRRGDHERFDRRCPCETPKIGNWGRCFIGHHSTVTRDTAIRSVQVCRASVRTRSCQLRPTCGLRGVRVGEASHRPGPVLTRNARRLLSTQLGVSVGERTQLDRANGESTSDSDDQPMWSVVPRRRVRRVVVRFSQSESCHGEWGVRRSEAEHKKAEQSKPPQSRRQFGSCRPWRTI